MSTRLLRRSYLSIIGVLALAGVTAATATSAAPGWQSWEAVRVDETGSTLLQLWVRNGDAVFLQSSGDAVLRESRCEAGRLVERGAGSMSEVVHSDLTSDQCWAIATEPILGLARALRSGHAFSEGPTATVDGRDAIRVTFRAESPYRSAVLQKSDLLPSAVELKDGTVVQYEFRSPRVAVPPAYRADASLTTERYTPMGSDQARIQARLDALPGRIGAFSLASSFEYMASADAPPAYYVIWEAPDGQQIQVVLNTNSTLPSSSLGMQRIGTAQLLIVQDGADAFQVYAPNLEAMRSALQVLRPKLASIYAQESP